MTNQMRANQRDGVLGGGDVEHDRVVGHEAASSLIVEANLAGDEGVGQQFVRSFAYTGNLRVGEDDAQRGTTMTRFYRGKRRGVTACDSSLV